MIQASTCANQTQYLLLLEDRRFNFTFDLHESK